MRHPHPWTLSCYLGQAIAAALLFFQPPAAWAGEGHPCLPTLSTGVSSEERQEPHRDYSLKLVFSRHRELLAQVKVTIWQGEKKIVEASEAGPWFLAKLPAGTYRIAASSANGKERTATVEIAGGGKQKEVMMNFP